MGGLGEAFLGSTVGNVDGLDFLVGPGELALIGLHRGEGQRKYLLQMLDPKPTYACGVVSFV